MEPALAATRIVKFSGHALESIGRARLENLREAPLQRLRKKAHRLSGLAGEVCRLHGFRFEVEGNVPSEPCVMVANHVSYIDAPVLMSLGPCAPIAKAEIAGWPLIGEATRALGVVFVKRGDAHSGAIALRHALRALDAGVSVLGFPEGTTTTGNKLLSFRRGLFGLARIAGVPVVPIALAYASPEVAWVDDQWFITHYLRTAMRKETLVSVRVGAPIASRTAAASAAGLAELTRARIGKLLWRSR
jgi:1-acyl-sn-glycerol-3-phosphate acyltransferase